ncbi:Proteasome subunit beta type-7 [Gurleya vavrai]
MKKFVTTTSILSFKYKNGIIIATDTHGLYGSMARYKNITRTFSLTKNCIIAYSGEVSDIQKLHSTIQNELIKDQRMMNAKGIYKMVQRILYSRRSQLKPLNVNCVVAGKENDDFFLGAINPIGNFYESDVICTNLASYLITPFLREKIKEVNTKEEAIKLMKEAVQIALRRDCFSANNTNFAILDNENCEITEPIKIEMDWKLSEFFFD